MSKKTRTQNPAEVELTAPVAYRAEACRAADESWLPQTVYFVVDRENCKWFQIGNEFFPESRTVIDGGLHVAGLVTMLPTRYFVR